MSTVQFVVLSDHNHVHYHLPSFLLKAYGFIEYEDKRDAEVSSVWQWFVLWCVCVCAVFY